MRIRLSNALLLGLLLPLLMVPTPAQSQSVNMDLDIFFPDETIGGGAPSDSFGGAASQPGRWNRVYVNDPGPTLLVGLDGTSTALYYSVIGGVGSGGGYFFP